MDKQNIDGKQIDIGIWDIPSVRLFFNVFALFIYDKIYNNISIL